MKFAKAIVLAGALAAAAAPSFAEARGWHGHGHRGGGWGFGLGLGLALSAPVWAGYYAPRVYAPAYYAPPYAYAPPYVAPAYAYPPVEYAQQPAPVQQAQQQWYYCASANGYYPYVRECASGWQPVSPRPPGF